MMAYFNIDTVLFTAFLAVNLILGLVAGRKVKSLRDYSIGKKDFSTATITSTIVATWIGGGFMFYGLQNIYTTGLQFIMPLIGGTLCLLFTGQVLAVRMGEFLDNFSVAEAMGDLYGKAVQMVTAIGGILSAIGSLAIQFQVISKMLTLLLGFQGPWVTIAAATIVILYSAFGGIRSVVITDVFQFIAFGVFIPIIALIIWNHLKDPSQVVDTLKTNPIFNLKELIGWNPKFLSSIGLMLYFAIPGMKPPIFQRVTMAKDLHQVKNSFTYAALVRLFMIFSIVWIAVLLLADNPNLDPKNLVNHIINHYTYPGFKGFIAVGITAMAMSTADSYLNSCAVLAVNDIIKLLRPSSQESIVLIRLLSIGIGVLALLLALRTTDLLELMLLAGSLYMPIVSIPLLFAILGFRSSTKAVLIGMIAGLATVVIWGKYFAYTGINNVIPGMIANLSFFMGSHYLLREKGGWVGIKDPAPLLAARQARKEALKNLINKIKHPKIYSYLKENLPQREVVYTFFGIYIMGATYILFYTLPQTTDPNYVKLYDLITHSVLIIMAVLMTYPAWPPTIKQVSTKIGFMTFGWPAAICYTLFVVGTLLVLMSKFHQVQVMILMLNWVIAATLLSWPLLLFLSSIGIMLGLGVFYHYTGVVPVFDLVDGMQFKFIYGILLMSSFLIAIFRQKQDKKRIEDKAAYLLKVNETARTQTAEVLQYRNELYKELNEEQQALFDSTTAAYIHQAIYRMTDYLRLDVSLIPIEKLRQQIHHVLSLQEIDPKPELLFKANTPISSIQADFDKLVEMIVASISYIQQHNPSHKPIIISLEDAKLGHTVDHIKDYIKQLAGLKITITTQADPLPIQKLYMVNPTQSASLHPQSIDEPMLLDNLRIADAHYGYMDLNQPDTHVYVIPVDVREVRGKVMELLREPAAMVPDELKHPLAIELEKRIFERLKDTSVDQAIIQKAVNVIKKYHGGVKRNSGEPFFTHPMQVALILMDYTKDQDAILGALLHDSVEDTSFSIAQIEAKFGHTVASLVNKATNLEDKLRRVNLQDYETNYRLTHNEDERAALIKLSDRLHNMRTIKGHPSIKKQQHIAKETLQFFVPLAKQFKLSAIGNELEALCLEILGE